MQYFNPMQEIKSCFTQTIASVDPDNLMQRLLSLNNGMTYYKDQAIVLNPKGRLIIAGAGKAAVKMGHAILSYCPGLPDENLFISPDPDPMDFFNVYVADHPYPSQRSFDATHKMMQLLESLTSEDNLIFCLSGGASSLMAYPQPFFMIRDLNILSHILMVSGMSIREMNTIRQRVSRIKGGKLAKLCRAKTTVFYISDVPNDDISIVGSGPFAPPLQDPIEKIISKYHLEKKIPKKLITSLLHEKPTIAVPKVPHYVVGNNRTALNSIARACGASGLNYRIFPDFLKGSAESTGEKIGKMCLNEKKNGPIALIMGGETYVNSENSTGKGGRSQETALSILKTIKDTPGITCLCAGTDGIDGPTDAAGAVVNAGIYQKSQNMGLPIYQYLENHDSYNFHEKCGSLLKTGPTGTNVCDVAIAFIE